MNEQAAAIYVYDLDISDKSKGFLARAGMLRLSDLLGCDAEKLSNMRGMRKETLSELLDVKAHANDIISQFEEREQRIHEVLPKVQDIPITEISMGTRAFNALKCGGVSTVGTLIQMSQKDIYKLRNVGTLSRDEIVSAINSIIDEGETFFERQLSEGSGQEYAALRAKGFDFSVIDTLIENFGFRPVRLTEWFGLSKQWIYNALDVRSPARRAVWTGKTLSDTEISILADVINSGSFDYRDDTVICCCMNNSMDDFVCLFIYEREIKCFFLKDLPEQIREAVIGRNMHRYTKRELAGEASGRIIYILTKPYYRPTYPDRFRANAQLRSMTLDEYAQFISGYPYADQRSVTDEQIIAFLRQNMVDGGVYISSDPKNQWIRSIASRNGYGIKELVELYGFRQAKQNGTEFTTGGAKQRHLEELRKYVVRDNIVYLPTDSSAYRVLHAYAYKLGMDLNSYIHSLGFKRTAERPDTAADALERDMEVRQSDGPFEDKVFGLYPLIGSRILKSGTLNKLNENARAYIDRVLKEPGTRLSLRGEMQITLALINNAKDWKNEENSNFWSYISLQFGYRDTSGNGAVVRLLQSSLESAMKKNGRLFLEDMNGREFKATVLVHAMSTRKSWMLLFDFLFDFYKNNLHRRIIQNDPLIPVMVRALRQKLAGEGEDDAAVTISSKVYSFQEGIRKLVFYRPGYTCKLFEKLIGKIDSLYNAETRPAKTYEEQLCEEWYKEKIRSIANTVKAERHGQTGQRDIAIDYSRIRPKYILKNETDVQLVLPDVRLKDADIQEAVLQISSNGAVVIQKRLSWYGNILGKTLNGVSVSLTDLNGTENGLNIQVSIICDGEQIYDSEDDLNRSYLLFYGGAEVSASQIRRDRYTLVVPVSAEVKTENADRVDVEELNNPGLNAFFLELKDAYVITVNNKLIAFDSENGTGIRVIMPAETSSLPTVSLRDTEAVIAYRSSVCSIILGSADIGQQYVLLKDGERIGFASLQRSDDGLIYTFPMDDESEAVRLQVIDLLGEKLVFDRTFLLANEASCGFDRAFYYAADDYAHAEYHVDIDDCHEVIPFSAGEEEIRIPFRNGLLHVSIPKVEVTETSGAWLQEPAPAWYVGTIPQTSMLKVVKPAGAEVRFFVGGQDILYDDQGLVTIGNVLQALNSVDGPEAVGVEMRVNRMGQRACYMLAKVFCKERFLNRPVFWTEGKKLCWDHGGAFIGMSGRTFTLCLTGADSASFSFVLDDNTESLQLPDEMPVGNYQYEISFQVGGLFRREKEIIAVGDCVIGDKNLLRFMGRRIAVRSITDEFKGEAGHICIQTCYIDKIEFLGMEDTSEGYCPVYSGVMFTRGRYGERYEFSYDAHTNKRGITKMTVNPVRIVYINDTTLCITDADGDGLYYYSYYDRDAGTVLYALTDREYTKENKHRYSNADLYLYRTERN